MKWWMRMKRKWKIKARNLKILNKKWTNMMRVKRGQNKFDIEKSKEIDMENVY